MIDKNDHAGVLHSPVCKGTSLGTDDTLCLYEEDRDTPIVTLHELGHYLFCLADEYQSDIWERVDGVDKIVERANTELSFCSVKRASPPSATVNPKHSCVMFDNNYPDIYSLPVFAAHFSPARRGTMRFPSTPLPTASHWMFRATVGAPSS